MRNHVRLGLASIIAAMVVAITGCYTQLGSVRSERDHGDEDTQYSGAVDTTSGDYTNDQGDEYYFDQNGYPRNRWYFDYYYPPYYDPFSYRWNYNSYYDPYWNGYGPYYPTTYMGWGYLPFPDYYYYSPYSYSRYRAYGYGGTGRGYGTTRTIGNVRATGTLRGGVNDFNNRPTQVTLPTGARSVSSGNRTPATVVPKTSTGNRRSSGHSGTVQRSGNTRTGSTRGTRTEPRRDTSSHPARSTPPRDSGGQRSSGGERSGGASTTSSAPASSPPSSQGSAPSNTGSRGSGSRR